MIPKIRCILLIDDNRADNFLHRLAIEEAGCADHVEEALSGEAALKWLQQLAPDELPELIFLDINMPGMDGWEFLDHLAAFSPTPYSQVLIVMLSTSSDPEEIKRGQQDARLANFLPKPLTSESLQSILLQHLSAR
jgi:CheY-like chemotaxis protein